MMLKSMDSRTRLPRFESWSAFLISCVTLEKQPNLSVFSSANEGEIRMGLIEWSWMLNWLLYVCYLEYFLGHSKSC